MTPLGRRLFGGWTGFADSLELTGEALMRKGDYRRALAKFRSADEAAS